MLIFLFLCFLCSFFFLVIFLFADGIIMMKASHFWWFVSGGWSAGPLIVYQTYTGGKESGVDQIATRYKHWHLSKPCFFFFFLCPPPPPHTHTCQLRWSVLHDVWEDNSAAREDGACAHYVMVSKFQWKPFSFWLATGAPSEIHRMTGLPPKIVWTMTYLHIWCICTGPVGVDNFAKNFLFFSMQFVNSQDPQAEGLLIWACISTEFAVSRGSVRINKLS